MAFSCGGGPVVGALQFAHVFLFIPLLKMAEGGITDSIGHEDEKSVRTGANMGAQGKQVELKQQQKTTDFLEGAQSLITVVVLVLCCLAAFCIRLFAVIRFESIIHEFDPW